LQGIHLLVVKRGGDEKGNKGTDLPEKKWCTERKKGGEGFTAKGTLKEHTILHPKLL